MDQRAAKLALARKKLKDHQEKKTVSIPKESDLEITHEYQQDVIKPIANENVYNEIKQGIIEPNTLKEQDINQNLQRKENDVCVTEMLISSKRNLEIQMNDLQSQLSQLQQNLTSEIYNHNLSKQHIYSLENSLKAANEKLTNITKENIHKDQIINELNAAKSSITEEHNNLLEQMEFTKTILTAKENENSILQNQLQNIQNQLDITQLQLQQVTNGSPRDLTHTEKQCVTEKNDEYLQKIVSLEQKLKELHKEKDQLSIHYEHYVGELNEQLKSVIAKNEELTKEINSLSNRENSLIDHISDMEIRLQNYNIKHISVLEHSKENSELIDLKENYENVKRKLQELTVKHEELEKQYLESVAKITELSQVKEPVCDHDNISITKLNADITSDKIAAQRATEQNKKLKSDLHGLEEDFVKMSQDKLELTEKLAAEKYLNRELTLKLAEIDEKAKDMYIKLMAKDEEMIRLQTNYRDIERKCNALSDKVNQLQEKQMSNVGEEKEKEASTENTDSELQNGSCHEKEPLISTCDATNRLSIPMEDAMLKLQDRFLKIMGEVADLADEKHRLEHIILQLQNETETICEYVALYQQQRSLLKKRDEERSAQIKIFQAECDRLKSQLQELGVILLRFAEDKELSSYFQVESRHNDITNVMNLLSNLKNNLLLDSERKYVELKNFYPCNCCSGQLIDV